MEFPLRKPEEMKNPADTVFETPFCRPTACTECLRRFYRLLFLQGRIYCRKKGDDDDSDIGTIFICIRADSVCRIVHGDRRVHCFFHRKRQRFRDFSFRIAWIFRRSHGLYFACGAHGAGAERTGGGVWAARRRTVRPRRFRIRHSCDIHHRQNDTGSREPAPCPQQS